LLRGDEWDREHYQGTDDHADGGERPGHPIR
jgi:hypothetical protein